MENQENSPNLENRESEEEIVQRLHELKMRAYRGAKDSIALHKDTIFPFAIMLKEKHPDYYSCRLYHLLIGSSIPPDLKITRFDFPGEDSIQKFIENLSPEQ